MQLEGEQDTAGTFQLLPLFGSNLSMCWQICCLMEEGEVHGGQDYEAKSVVSEDLWGPATERYPSVPQGTWSPLWRPRDSRDYPPLTPLWCSRPALPGTTAGYPREEEAITEVL